MDMHFIYYAVGFSTVFLALMALIHFRMRALGKELERLGLDMERKEELAIQQLKSRGSSVKANREKNNSEIEKTTNEEIKSTKPGIFSTDAFEASSEQSAYSEGTQSTVEAPFGPIAEKSPDKTEKSTGKSNFIEVEVYNNRTGKIELIRQELHSDDNTDSNSDSATASNSSNDSNRDTGNESSIQHQVENQFENEKETERKTKQAIQTKTEKPLEDKLEMKSAFINPADAFIKSSINKQNSDAFQDKPRLEKKPNLQSEVREILNPETDFSLTFEDAEEDSSAPKQSPELQSIDNWDSHPNISTDFTPNASSPPLIEAKPHEQPKEYFFHNGHSLHCVLYADGNPDAVNQRIHAIREELHNVKTVILDFNRINFLRPNELLSLSEELDFLQQRQVKIFAANPSDDLMLQFQQSKLDKRLQTML